MGAEQGDEGFVQEQLLSSNTTAGMAGVVPIPSLQAPNSPDKILEPEQSLG